jgi:hypothetical protein
MAELSKREKKIAHELIQKGLLEELKRGMLSFDAILQQWKTEQGDIQEHYYKIYSAVKDFDKQIAWRYDRISGSMYLDVITWQLIDKLYDVAELDEFQPEIKDKVLSMVNGRVTVIETDDDVQQ